MLLEVDALAQAIGSDQNPERRLPHLVDPLLPDFVGKFAGDHLDIEFRELGAEHGPNGPAKAAKIAAGASRRTTSRSLEWVFSPITP